MSSYCTIAQPHYGPLMTTLGKWLLLLLQRSLRNYMRLNGPFPCLAVLVDRMRKVSSRRKSAAGFLDCRPSTSWTPRSGAVAVPEGDDGAYTVLPTSATRGIYPSPRVIDEAALEVVVRFKSSRTYGARYSIGEECRSQMLMQVVGAYQTWVSRIF